MPRTAVRLRHRVCLLHAEQDGSETLGDIMPMEALTGDMPDISELFDFEFREPVRYFENPEIKFRKPKQMLGRWLGITESVGQAMCYIGWPGRPEGLVSQYPLEIRRDYMGAPIFHQGGFALRGSAVCCRPRPSKGEGLHQVGTIRAAQGEWLDTSREKVDNELLLQVRH